MKEPSYKFIDPNNGLVIYIAKNQIINIAKSKVFNKEGKQISELMYNK